MVSEVTHAKDVSHNILSEKQLTRQCSICDSSPVGQRACCRGCRPVIKTPVNLPTHGELERSFHFKQVHSISDEFYFLPLSVLEIKNTNLEKYCSSKALVAFISLNSQRYHFRRVVQYLNNCDKMTRRLSYQMPQSDRQPCIHSFILLSGKFLSLCLSVFQRFSLHFFFVLLTFQQQDKHNMSL